MGGAGVGGDDFIDEEVVTQHGDKIGADRVMITGIIEPIREIDDDCLVVRGEGGHLLERGGDGCGQLLVKGETLVDEAMVIEEKEEAEGGGDEEREFVH